MTIPVRTGLLVLVALLTSRVVYAQDPTPVPIAEGEVRRTLPGPKHGLDAVNSYYKPGTGLVLKSTDRDFALATRLRAQFRYSLNNPKGAAATQVLQIRRARLQFKGNLYGKHNKFKVELAFSPADVGRSDSGGVSNSPLLDWYMDFTQLRDLNFRVGQYKVPHNPQRLVSSGNLQLVDRSIVNSEFTLDRDLGMDVRSKDVGGWNLFRYYVGVFAGEGRNTRGAYDFGMMYLARIEVLPFGMFKDYSEADLKRSPKPRLRLGIAYAREQNARGNRGIRGSAPADGGTTDIHSFGVDSVFKISGFTATFEGMLRQGKRNAGGAAEASEETGVEVPIAVQAPRDGFGAMLQVGYLLPSTNTELAGRAAWVRPMGADTSLRKRSEFGGGLGYYFAGNPFKLQADYFRLTSEQPNGEQEVDNQLRVQLQASF